MNKKTLLLWVVSTIILLSSINMISALFVNLPTQDITQSRWTITHTTDYDYTPYIANEGIKKTTIGLIPNDNSCVGKPATKRLYDRNGLEIKDDKNKPIDLKCETAKCGTKNCYSITLTAAQAVNINDYIRIGNASTTYEWLNNTFTIHPVTEYEVEPFAISIWDCNGNRFEYPNVNWTTNTSSDDKIVFYPMLGQTNLSCIRFRTNTLESAPLTIQTANQFQGEKTTSYKLSFEDFEAKNNITSRNVTLVYPTFWESFFDTFPFVWRIFSYKSQVQYYDIEYRGSIVDLDPSLDLTLTTSYPDAIQFNQTEGSNTGARLSASVLSMDFNQDGENYLNLPYQNKSLYEQGTYIKDGSVYNNFGTSSGLTKQVWWNGNTNGTSIINGSLQFDGVNDYVKTPSGAIVLDSAFTISAWFYTLSGSASQEIFSYSNNFAELRINGNKLVGTVDGGSKVSVTGATSFTNNTWHHGILVYNGTTMFIYLDGVHDGNLTTGYTPLYNYQSTVGAYSTGVRPFNGSIDDVIIWGRALNETEISTIYSEGVAGRTVDMDTNPVDTRVFPTEGRVAYFSFNTNESGNVAESWNSLNASYTGTALTWSNGGYGNTGMYRFDGTTSARINVTSSQLNLTGDHSWGAWIKSNNYVAVRSIIGKGGTGGGFGGQQYGIQTYDGKYLCQLGNNTATAIKLAYDNINVPINTWRRIDCVWNSTSSQLFIYANGILVSNTSTSPLSGINAENYPLTIGAQATWASIDGYIDEVTIFNKTLNASEVLGLHDATRKKLHLQLDNLNGTITNSIGENSSITGTLTNYPTTALTAPVYNATGGVDGSGAYEFDGVDDYIQTLSSTSNDKMTISLWFNANNFTDYSSIVGTAAASNLLSGWGVLWRTDNTLRFWINGATTNIATIPFNSSHLNSWHHVVGTYSQSEGIMRIWMDGVEGTNYTYNSVIATVTPPVIGKALASYTGWQFNGTIDNVQIFNRALSAQEVLALYNGTLANRTIKYSTKQGDFTSGVFYNSTLTYWNISLATADTINKSGIVNTDNSINRSDSKLLLYLPFDNNLVDTKFGNNATGTHSSSIVNNATGLYSSAMRFPGGTTDCLNGTSNIGASSGNKNITVSMWISPAQVPASGNRYLFQLDQGSGFVDYDLSLIYTASGVKLYANTQREGTVTGTTSFTANNWYHVVAVFNQAGDRRNYIYVNGQFDGNGSAATSAIAGASKYEIGGYMGCSQERFNGTIDDITVYNTSLSASQISQLYKSGLSQKANTNVTLQTRTANSYNISDPSLVSFWALNNGTGENSTYFKDETGRNNGTCGTFCPIYNSSSGIVGGGYLFNITNQSINTSIESNFDFLTSSTSNFTVSMWIRTVTATGEIIAKEDNNYYVGTRIYLSSGKILLEKRDLQNSWRTWTHNTITVNDNKWHHVTVVYTGSLYTGGSSAPLLGNIYIDGISNFSVAGPGNYNVAEPNNNNTLVLGGNSVFFNGSIDEVRIYNRSLSADEVMNLYQLGSYHIEWDNDWTNQTLVQDSAGTLTSASGKFMQFRSNLITNDTDVSPYVNAYNVTVISSPVTINQAPNVTWLSQTPADISTVVVFENNTLITYNITDDDGVSGLNSSNVTFFWKVNTTTSNAIQFFLNGTSYQNIPGMVTSENFFSRKSQWTNVSELWTQSLNANEFLPATYNYNEFVMEYTTHQIGTLTNTDDSLLVNLQNINNETQYNFFEIMINSTANAAPLQFYYCNSSYSYLNKVTTDGNCHMFNTLLNTQVFNHNHTNNSKHQVLSMFINTSSGTTDGVKVTSNGSFIARMTGGTGSWDFYYISNTTRTGAIRTSNNAGTTWTNQTYTIDSHFHQFYNDSALWYYACASDTVGKTSCSTLRADSLELGNLPPTAPEVYNPTAGYTQEDGSIVINYTQADSPNGYAITYYNVSLFNLDFTFNSTLIENNSNNLGYIWNGTIGGVQWYGTFHIGVTAYDINNLSSIGYSGNFTRLADATLPFIEIQKPIQDLWQDLVFSVKINATDANGISAIWYNFNQGMNYTYTTETTKYLTNGQYTIYAYANDSYGNINSTSRLFNVGNVQSNQTCPSANATGSWSQTGSYANGTVICSFVETISSTQINGTCTGSYVSGINNGTVICKKVIKFKYFNNKLPILKI